LDVGKNKRIPHPHKNKWKKKQETKNNKKYLPTLQIPHILVEGFIHFCPGHVASWPFSRVPKRSPRGPRISTMASLATSKGPAQQWGKRELLVVESGSQRLSFTSLNLWKQVETGGNIHLPTRKSHINTMMSMNITLKPRTLGHIHGDIL
jgi:hypothetical protein